MEDRLKIENLDNCNVIKILRTKLMIMRITFILGIYQTIESITQIMFHGNAKIWTTHIIISPIRVTH